MSKSRFMYGVGAAIVVGVVGFAGWVFSLPSMTSATEAPPVPLEETNAMLAALRPERTEERTEEGTEHPLVAVIGLNDATETTDYLIPTGILRRADVAEVMMLATAPGPVQLYPSLEVEPDATIGEFDAAHPQGADYVIVPAMSRDDDPAVLAWLQSQSRKGARIIGICAGAKVVAAAGLLDGHRATTHWYYVDDLLEHSPTIDHVADRRIVSDRNVTTTTGITASMPMMLTLIEAIAGRTRAEAVARDLGLGAWDTRHASAAFALTRRFASTVTANKLRFWNRDTWQIELQPEMDEVSLALVADAWSRTYRSQAISFSASTAAITTANGIRILADKVGNDTPEQGRISIYPEQPPAQALDLTLAAIGELYGENTSHVVAVQLEYPWPESVP